MCNQVNQAKININRGDSFCTDKMNKFTLYTIILFGVLHLTASAPVAKSALYENIIFNNQENLSFKDCGKAQSGETFPWNVKVKIDENRACPGVLISSRDVIASSTCLNNIDDASLISVTITNNTLTPTATVISPTSASNEEMVLLNLHQTIPNVMPICLWNLGEINVDPPIFSFNANIEKSQMHATTLEDPKVCKQFIARGDALSAQANDNFLCTTSDLDSDIHQPRTDYQFLINEFDGRWYLRGIKLQEISLQSKLLAAYIDLSLHLRWIAEKSFKVYALPKIPSPKKAFDFKTGEENLSYPSCGLSNDYSADDEEHIGNQIFGGWDDATGAHPWYAKIEIYKENPASDPMFCGGTLIRDNVIITAAHCVWFDNKAVSSDRVDVSMGSSPDRDFDQMLHPSQIIVHEKFGKYRHDIALLIFKTGFQLTNKVSPLCLWNKHSNLNYIVDTHATVVGFGVHQIGSSGVPETPGKLQRADLPIVSHDKCFQTGNDATFWNRLLPGENFCAGFKNEGRSTCQGDSGGGLAIKHNGRWFLRGIVSFGTVLKGTSVCDPNNYSVFVDVTHYLEWIEKRIKETVESDGVHRPSWIEYSFSLIFNFVATHYIFMFVVLLLGLSFVFAVILCRFRHKADKFSVQFHSKTSKILEKVQQKSYLSVINLNSQATPHHS